MVIPPLTSNCVSIYKDTSLASVVAMPDLLKQATDAQALMANPTPLIGAAIIYLAFLWPLVRLGQLSRGARQAAAFETEQISTIHTSMAPSAPTHSREQS